MTANKSVWENTGGFASNESEGCAVWEYSTIKGMEKVQDRLIQIGDLVQNWARNSTQLTIQQHTYLIKQLIMPS